MKRSVFSSSRLALATLGLLGPVLGCSTDADSTKAPAPPRNPDADGTPLAEVVPHWDALVARSDGALAVRWSAHGTPMSIFGTISAPQQAASAADARRFLADNAQLLQLTGNVADLDEVASFESPLGTHVTFVQRYQGVRVLGAEIKVHFNRAGRIVALNNTSVPHLHLDTHPAIAAQDALDVALAAVPATARDDADAPEAPELVIHTDTGTPALVYRVVVPTGGPTLEFFVDAKTGAVLGEPTDLNRYLVNGTGQVFKDNAVVATQNNNLVDGGDAASAVPSVATGLRGDHFHRDLRYPGDHPSKQSGSGISVELCLC